MKESSLRYLCNPSNHEELGLVEKEGRQWLVGASTGQQFPITDGIPSFLGGGEVTGENKRYQALYDRIARGYDLSENLVAALLWGGRDKVRRGLVKDVELQAGQDFLEVSIGTGANIPYLPAGANYFGLDISMGMLQQCRRSMKRARREVELFHASAESLPFKDAAFDVVYHFGGINFFNDIQAAVCEMIRVAKPGAKVLFGDETQDLASENVKLLLPYAKEFYKGKTTISAPVHLVPPGMQEVRSEQLSKGRFYMVSFRTPKG